MIAIVTRRKIKLALSPYKESTIVNPQLNASMKIEYLRVTPWTGPSGKRSENINFHQVTCYSFLENLFLAGNVNARKNLRFTMKSIKGGSIAPDFLGPNTGGDSYSTGLLRIAMIVSIIPYDLLEPDLAIPPSKDGTKQSRNDFATDSLESLGAEFPKNPPSMKAKPSHPAFSMSTSLRVSPSIHGYHFDTASRKKAVGNIFENIDQEALQRLFKNSGDKKAEERAKIIFAIDQDLEEKTRALMALKKRTKDKLFQFLKLRKYSIKVH
ncbi:hypothetical protein MJT46_018736 [Ovis ammon polii x Ovis aries]|nr:hypothetical protein MJT46_018736 [Ovis ammon polii x Ovis aries]